MESGSRCARFESVGSLGISSIDRVGVEVATLCTRALALGVLDLKHRIRFQSRALSVIGDIFLADLRHWISFVRLALEAVSKGDLDHGISFEGWTLGVRKSCLSCRFGASDQRRNCLCGVNVADTYGRAGSLIGANC